jgi:cytochrome c peroxidase
MQALLPIESAVEFGSSRLFAVHALDQQHREEYEALFGPLPALTDTNRFPPSGGPGDPAWDALPEADRFEVTRAFVNIGKSLAAFERSQQPLPNVLDQYGSGTLDALDDEQKDGLATFFDAGCAQCHYGPLLTDGAFHNLRFPSGRRDRMGDRGRLDGLVQLRESEFRRSGPFSDAPGAFAPPDSFPAALGAFKTPGLRGVGYSLPYGHGGSYWGLTSVLEAHRVGGLPAESPYAVGDVEPFLPAFDAALVPKIMKFLVALRLDVETGIEGAP